MYLLQCKIGEQGNINMHCNINKISKKGKSVAYQYPFISIFLIEKPVINVFLKIIGVQNQLPITFCSDLLCNKTLKARNSTPTHTNF